MSVDVGDPGRPLSSRGGIKSDFSSFEPRYVGGANALAVRRSISLVPADWKRQGKGQKNPGARV